MADNTAPSASARRMVETLTETPKLHIDKLPVLHAIFERVATSCSENLRQMCAAPTTFFVNQVKGDNSWDILENYEDAIAALIYVPEWDAMILIGVDRKFVFSLLEVSYGAEGNETPFDSDRPFSTLEGRFAKEFLMMAAQALQSCFETVGSVTFKFDRLETKVEFTIMGPNDVPVVAAQVLFQVMDNGGRMFILIPQSALYPIRKKLEREHQPISLPNDPRWTKRMQRGIAQTEVKLEAILEKRVMMLGDVTQFQVGQLLELRTHSYDLITLESGDEPLFRAKLGQANDKFIVIIESAHNEKAAQKKEESKDDSKETKKI
jgi:flagellar motor switch protein FliM